MKTSIKLITTAALCIAAAGHTIKADCRLCPSRIEGNRHCRADKPGVCHRQRKWHDPVGVEGSHIVYPDR